MAVVVSSCSVQLIDIVQLSARPVQTAPELSDPDPSPAPEGLGLGRFTAWATAWDVNMALLASRMAGG